jgi:hypothetical protein
MLQKKRLRYKNLNQNCEENFDYVIHATQCNMWYYVGFFPSTHHSILKRDTYYKIFNVFMDGEYLSYKKFDKIMDKL